MFRLVMRQALLLLVPGLALGLAAGVALGRFADNMFYGVSPADPAIFIVVSTLLVTTGLVASCVPARRAVRIDPIRTLRAE